MPGGYPNRLAYSYCPARVSPSYSPAWRTPSDNEVAAQIARKDRRENLLVKAGKWGEIELRGQIMALQELIGWQEEGGTRQPGWGKIDKSWRDIRDRTKNWGQNQVERHLTELLDRLPETRTEGDRETQHGTGNQAQTGGIFAPNGLDPGRN
jgi:hypothetical protein